MTADVEHVHADMVLVEGKDVEDIASEFFARGHPPGETKPLDHR